MGMSMFTGGGGLSASSSATSTSGDARAGDVGGGISSPVVVGGFKSNGSASAFSIPVWAWIVGALFAGAMLYKIAK